MCARGLALILVALVVYVAAELVPARHAEAVPSFAREHGLKCNDCHAGFPRLNDFGMEFKQRGFRLPGKEGKAIWDQTTLPVSMLGVAQYINEREANPVTKSRTSLKSSFELVEIALVGAGTAAPKIGYFIEAVAPVAEDKPFAVEQGWAQYSDLLPAASLNVKAGKMLNEFFYLSQLRRLALQAYASPVTFNVTGVELNGQWAGFRYAAGMVNDERQSSKADPTNTSASNLNRNAQGFYGWTTYSFAEQVIGIRYINTKSNSDNPSPVIDGRTRQQLDANLLLRYGPAELILGYFHNWDIGGIAGQDRRNYLIEGIGEIMQDRLFLDVRFELQDTGTRVGGNNPTKANGTLVVTNLSYYVVPNVRLFGEFSKQSGEGMSVVGFVDPNGTALGNQERYLVGVQMGF